MAAPSDAELRKAMHHFIDSNMNLTPLADEEIESAFLDQTIDVEECIRKLMHDIADAMDFHNIDAHGNTQGSDYGSSESAASENKALNVGNHFFEMCIKASPCLTLPRSLQHHLIRVTRHCIALQSRQRLRFKHSVWSRMDFLISKALEYRDSMLSDREQQRQEFLKTAALQRPLILRLIDIKATCLAKQVMLIDYWADGNVQQVGYTAISHTYGYEVYAVFDCQCATKCSANMSHSRCSNQSCPHADGKDSEHNRVVNDILGMCANLLAAGVQYAWHDGVCIKQCDEEELTKTIMSMGWIYSHAKETVVFLHYVGKPMAPIRNGDLKDELIICRWHTRVWTMQEAALSKCRRYCVRVGTSPLGDCQNLEEFERKIASWYNDETSKIEVIEEQRFYEILLSEIGGVLQPLFNNVVTEIGEVLKSFPIHSINEVDMDEPNCRLSSLKARIRMARKAHTWSNCIYSLYATLVLTCFRFPTVREAISICSRRKSKHDGDRINSVLALSGVKGWVADKDKSLEDSTIEFFKRQGQKGLELAVFTANELFLDKDREYIGKVSEHTWVPLLWSQLASVIDGDSCLKYRVLDNKMVGLEGDLLCVKVECTVKGEGESSAIAVEDKPSDAHDSLCILLTRAGVKFRVTFLQAPQVPMGSAFIPAIPATFRKTNRFRAHLVGPMPRETIRTSKWPTLLVQGNLHTYVQKKGCFELMPIFVFDVIDKPFCTVLKKLIIK